MITLFSNFIPMNMLPFVFLSLAFMFHLLCVKVINNRKKKESYYKLNNKDFLSFQKYFDKYYVTNIWYTSFSVMLYIIGIFGIFLFARMLFMGYSLHINIMDTNIISWMNILFILFLIVSFMLLILFYKAFLDVTFFTECIKLYYYILYNSVYYKVRDYFMLEPITDFLNDLEVALEYITTTEDVFENDTNYIYFRNAELVKNNLTLWDHLRKAGQRYLLLWILFKILHNISKEYRNHLYRIYVLPQTIIILLGCVELFNGTIHYFYYGLPFLLVLNILGQYYMFLRNKDIMRDGAIYDHFYGKSNEYEKIRSYFSHDYDVFARETFTNEETSSLKEYYDYGKLTEYITQFLDETVHTISDKGSRSKIHKQQIIIILLFIIYNYGSVWSIALYIPLVVMYFFSTKVSYYKGEVDVPVDNSKYHKAFWVLLLLESILIYILILKAKFTFMDTDVLWDYGITIRHTYSMEDKITFFWKYFEYIMTHNVPPKEYEYIFDIIAQTGVEGEVVQKETLKDIKQFVYDLYGAYTYRELMEWDLVRQCLIEDYIAEYHKDYYAWVKQKDTIMCCIKNIVILGTFSKFFIMYVQAYHTITDFYLREQLAQWIADMIIKILYK